MYGYEDSEEEPGLCINYLLHLYARIKYFLPDFRQMQNVPYSLLLVWREQCTVQTVRGEGARV